MPRTKSYKTSSLTSASSGAATQVSNAEPARAVSVGVGELLPNSRDVTGSKIFYPDKWFGRGIDEWVRATVDSLAALVRSGRRTRVTVRSYGNGMERFFEFLVVGREVPLLEVPMELRPLHVSNFIGWLKRQDAAGRWLESSSRAFYQSTKATLKHMMEVGLIQGDPGRFFPRAGFRNSNQDESRHTAFSDTELERLAAALKADLSDAHHGRLVLAQSHALTIRYLIVAMRTGGNLTPLLEMARDALRPGLLPGTRRLRTLKRRSFKIEERAIKQGRVVEEPTLIPMDAVAVIEKTLLETTELVDEAPASIRNRVWLYRSQRAQQYGEVTCLTRKTVSKSIQLLVARRDIRGDDGKPLVLNTSRLRKSFGKRAFRLSGGDLVATAQMLGNTPKVADSNYLRIDEQLKEDGARFMGAEFMAHLRGDGLKSKIVPIKSLTGEHASKTPVAGCKDSLFGEHAPKDGTNHCDVFVMCLFCPSFAIVGELEDLWRLFSYQAFAKRELERLDGILGTEPSGDDRKDRLRALYRLAIPFIDEFTATAFGRKLVVAARARVVERLHPFWARQLERSESRSIGQGRSSQ